MKRLIRKQANESLFDRHLFNQDKGIKNPEPKTERKFDNQRSQIDPNYMPSEGYTVNHASDPDR